MTEHNILPTNEDFSAEEKNKEAENSAFRMGSIILGAAVVVTAFYLFLASQMGAWQMYALAGVIAAFTVATFTATRTIRAGNIKAGIWTIIIGMLIVFPAAALLISNIGLIFGITTVILTFVVANQTLPSREIRQALIASVIVGIVIAILDLVKLEHRLFVPEIQTFVPAITAVIVLLASFFFVRQAWNSVNESLPLKITVWTGTILTVASVILVSYSAITFRQTALQTAEQDALGHASTQAGFVRAEAEIPLDTARALAQALTAVKSPDTTISLSRDDVNAMLRQVAIENPSFLATYTLWEPNAFDGLDAQYVGAEAHDETGRFIPYWVRRSDGSVSSEALLAYETPVDGDWYLQPRSTKTEYTIAPLVYPVGGVDTVMATYTVPIVVEGTFYGITGVDAPITFVQELVDSIDLYDGTADAVLMSSSGTLIGVTNHPELVNQPASEIYSDFSDLQVRIEAGEAFISPSPDGQFLRVFAPVDIGQTDTHWAFSLLIPNNKITEEANASALTQAGIGFILVVVALFLLRYLTGQIVLPLVTLTGVASDVAAGNLNSRAEVTSSDEVGTLATTFNTMTSQLQDTLQGLEQRVEERTSNLRLAAQVGQTVSQESDLDTMLTQAAQLILEQFDLYYVQVYLTDERQSLLKLKSGTGTVGAQLLEREHSLPISTASLNGRAAIEKHSVVIPDTAKSPAFRKNALLPETRGEMAIPLIVQDRVVGVLDMQTSRPDELNEEVLPAFEALAGQLAVAIQNANLLEEAQQARADVEAQARRQIRSNWSSHLDAIHKPQKIGYLFDRNTVTSIADLAKDNLPMEGQALSAPIDLIGEELGSLVVELDESDQTDQNRELVKIVARQVVQQIENLRLLEEAERYRQESEEAAHRETREGWQRYIASRNQEGLMYSYNLNEVQVRANEENDQAILTLPLRARDEKVGSLSIQGIASGDQDSVQFANTIAQRLGDHIENLRLSEQTQQSLAEVAEQTERLGHLNDFSEALSQAETLDDIYKTSATMLPNIIDAARFSMTHPAAGGEMLEVFALQGEGGAIPTGTKLPIAGTAIGICFTERRGVIDPDLSENTYKESALLAKQGLKSTLSVPLIVAGESIGTVNFANTRVRAYATRDQDLAVQAASLMASAIENRQQYQRAQKQADRETMLNTISQKIQSATSVEAVLQIAARELGHALGAPMTIAQLSIKDQKEND